MSRVTPFEKMDSYETAGQDDGAAHLRRCGVSWGGTSLRTDCSCGLRPHPVLEHLILFGAQFCLVVPTPVQALPFRLAVGIDAVLLEQAPCSVWQNRSVLSTHELVRIKLQRREAIAYSRRCSGVRTMRQIWAPSFWTTSREEQDVRHRVHT